MQFKFQPQSSRESKTRGKHNHDCPITVSEICTKVNFKLKLKCRSGFSKLLRLVLIGDFFFRLPSQ